MTRPLALAFVVLVAVGFAQATEPPPSPTDASSMGGELDAIRQQLVALDIEEALLALNALLDRPELSEATRVAALDLRAQAHVASDDLDAAEKDYRAILEGQPGYAPSREVTSKKAMERFRRLQATMIGFVRLDAAPTDASLTVDGRPVSIPAAGVLPVLAGDRTLHLARKGFDGQDAVVHAVPGSETPVTIHLVPNARSLVVRTELDAVSVTLDGTLVGATARGSGPTSSTDAPATLLIEDVAIGGHEIRFEKACFATESLEEIVSVDLADFSPKLLRVVAMRPARARVTATGAHYDGELRVDGERAGTLPLTAFSICPGTRTLEVVASGRVVWSGVLTVEESDLTLDFSPRPNAVLVGTAWPTTWAAISASWSLRGRVDPPPAVDLTTRDAWSAVTLPAGTDLAVAVIPGAGAAGDERIVLYSPLLHEVEEQLSPPSASRPSWVTPTMGADLVDGGERSVVVASTLPGGPAANAGLLPGDRLVAIAGRSAVNAASAREAIAALGVGTELALEIAPPSQPARKVACQTIAESGRRVPPSNEASRILRAAWASVDAAAGAAAAAPALASLARLLESSGREAAALDAWRRVRSIGSGALAARAAYALGAGLEAAGKRAEAIEAFGQARVGALAGSDPVLAAAAVDRLADLGLEAR